MNRSSEHHHIELKRPLGARQHHRVKKAIVPKTNARIAILRRRLAVAQQRKASQYVITLLLRQIESLKSSKASQLRIGRVKYVGKGAELRANRSAKKRVFAKRSSVRSSAVEVISLADTRAHQHFIPQAIVSEPVRTFADRTAANVVKDSDALDQFEGVAFAMEGMPFTIRHYSGHPPKTSTIYLPQEISNVEEITARIAKILGCFGLPPSALVWQRKDDPDL